MRYIHQGETIPAGYGIAWVDPAANRLACYPVPIHLIVRARRAWYWIAGHRSGLVDENQSAAAMVDSWNAGYDAGFQAALEADVKRWDALIERNGVTR